MSYFSSFHLASLGRGHPRVERATVWSPITRFDDRWRWITASVVPRLRRFDADMPLVEANLRRNFADVRDYASDPCVLPSADLSRG